MYSALTMLTVRWGISISNYNKQQLYHVYSLSFTFTEKPKFSKILRIVGDSIQVAINSLGGVSYLSLFGKPHPCIVLCLPCPGLTYLISASDDSLLNERMRKFRSAIQMTLLSSSPCNSGNKEVVCVTAEKTITISDVWLDNNYHALQSG